MAEISASKPGSGSTLGRATISSESGEDHRPDRFDSWKEIAAYLKRGVRTVQRWEREEGLPVRRLQHDKLGSVYGFKQELDAWFASRGGEPEPAEAESAQNRAIAVLPFSDLSREKDQEYFCDGMAEEIIGRLSQLGRVRVASRASSFRFRGGLDTREVGRRLGVGALLEGSVRKSGEWLRVSVQLTSSDSGYQIWSKTFDKWMGDVFAIQEEIALEVVKALEIGMPETDSAAALKPPTHNLEAYDCYLRGRKFYFQYGPRDMDFAIQLFSRAVELDPEYPLAYAGLADCWSYLYLYSSRDDAIREQAEWASRKAVDLILVVPRPRRPGAWRCRYGSSLRKPRRLSGRRSIWTGTCMRPTTSTPASRSPWVRPRRRLPSTMRRSASGRWSFRRGFSWPRSTPTSDAPARPGLRG